MKLDFKWVVFLRALEKRPLKTYEEFKMYREIFGKHYLD